ncbi:hypothetical protein ACG74X_20550 [Marivita sp. S0852]|uniref:hypothetical protein n=1 Tax=Marivita sp. S0852 TaxID=3373893 RepID=UPI00398206A6
MTAPVFDDPRRKDVGVPAHADRTGCSQILNALASVMPPKRAVLESKGSLGHMRNSSDLRTISPNALRVLLENMRFDDTRTFNMNGGKDRSGMSSEQKARKIGFPPLRDNFGFGGFAVSGLTT